MSKLALVGLVVLGAIGCPSSKKEPAEPSASPSASGAGPVVTAPAQRAAALASALAARAPAVDPVPEFDLSKYPWHADDSLDPLPVHDDLLRRIEPPSGFTRVKVEKGSFGAWLRRLPLAAPGTPVLSFRGGTILPADHRNLAAVATVDVGKADLQQCADAVMRLHAEWKWSQGSRDMHYRAASGTDMPYARWERGERVVQRGQSIEWVPKAGSSKGDHASFRKYLDAVFAWANTVSLARQATVVALEDMRPGDFFILPGNPGHAVLVLDLARDDGGRRAVLLGQSYMPAQNFHVLRPRKEETWFSIEPELGGVQTPSWPKPFPWSSLRRLD